MRRCYKNLVAWLQIIHEAGAFAFGRGTSSVKNVNIILGSEDEKDRIREIMVTRKERILGPH
jgi:hypothetical protein